jgi:hypothetical protein
MLKLSCVNKEKTKLIRNIASEIALVLLSWFADRAKNKILDVGII